MVIPVLIHPSLSRAPPSPWLSASAASSSHSCLLRTASSQVSLAGFRCDIHMYPCPAKCRPKHQTPQRHIPQSNCTTTRECTKGRCPCVPAPEQGTAASATESGARRWQGSGGGEERGGRLRRRGEGGGVHRKRVLIYTGEWRTRRPPIE
jgi:hypothetical protein